MSEDAIEHDGLVAHVLDDRRLVINKGAQDNIKMGTRFVVYTVGEEIHDPRTGESLGILEEIKGKGEVVHVQDRMCTIKTFEFDMVIEPVPEFAAVFSLVKERKRKVYREFVDPEPGDYVRRIR